MIPEVAKPEEDRYQKSATVMHPKLNLAVMRPCITKVCTVLFTSTFHNNEELHVSLSVFPSLGCSLAVPTAHALDHTFMHQRAHARVSHIDLIGFYERL